MNSPIPFTEAFDSNAILELVKRRSPDPIVKLVEQALAARERLADNFARRDLQMLRSMKARTSRGLLIMGSANIQTLRAKYEYYCKSPRLLRATPDPSVPVLRRTFQ